MTEPALRATLGRRERLTAAPLISQVARTGKGVSVPPFRLVGKLMPLPEGVRAQVAFAVPKKFLKRAHDRNRVRRLMRDSYRLAKAPWLKALEDADLQCAWLLIYQANTTVEHAVAVEGISSVFKRWMDKNLKP